MTVMVSIVTVNFNQTDLTCALLDSIRHQDYKNIEITVVDNGSTVDPSHLFRTRYPEVRLIRNEKNLGFAGGNNLAIPGAKGAYFFFVNNDAEITKGCIAQLVQFLDQTPEAGIVSPLICYHGGPETVDAGRPTADGNAAFSLRPSTMGRSPLAVSRLPAAVIQYAGMPLVNTFTARSNMTGNGVENTGQYTLPFQTGYAHGAAMMVPRRVLEGVGMMQEDYFLYYEEVDWCERIRRSGYSVWVEPRALVSHKESRTMQGLGALKTYYLARNRILFMRRHYGGGRFAVFLLYMVLVVAPVRTIQYFLKGEWANCKAFLKGICWNFRPKTIGI